MADETVHALCNAHLLHNPRNRRGGKEPDGWAAFMQRLLEARDTVGHWYKTATAWDTLLEPVLDHYESLPPQPAIRDFHTRLCQRGKPRKVTLVAAMRKLLLILNAVVRDQVPWQPDRRPMAGET